MEAKSKHLRTRPDGTWNFGFWGLSSVSKLYRAGLESSLLSHDILASTDALSFLVMWLQSRCFMSTWRYVPLDLPPSQDGMSHINVIVLLRTRLDVFPSMFIYFFAMKVSIRMVAIVESSTPIFSHRAYPLSSACTLAPLQRLCFNAVQKKLTFSLLKATLVPSFFGYRLFAKR